MRKLLVILGYWVAIMAAFPVLALPIILTILTGNPWWPLLYFAGAALGIALEYAEDAADD